MSLGGGWCKVGGDLKKEATGGGGWGGGGDRWMEEWILEGGKVKS